MQNESIKTVTDGPFRQRSGCPACGKASFDRIFSRSYRDPEMIKYLHSFYPLLGGEIDLLKGEDYTLYSCKDCGLIFQSPVLKDHFIEKLYADWISASDSLELDLNNQQLEDAHLFDFLLLAPMFSGRKLSIYDFGMGWGKWLSTGTPFAAKIRGFDLDPERCSYAASKGIEVVPVENLERESCDVINVRAVFEHLIYPQTVLTQLSEKLTPGGILKFSVPYAKDVRQKIINLDRNFSAAALKEINEIAPLEHVNTFSHKTIVSMGAQLGLSPVYFSASEYYRAIVKLDNGRSKKMVAMLRAILRYFRQFQASTVYLKRK